MDVSGCKTRPCGSIRDSSEKVMRMKRQNLAGLVVVLCVAMMCGSALAFDRDDDSHVVWHMFCDRNGKCVERKEYCDIDHRCISVPATKQEKAERLHQYALWKKKNLIQQKQYRQDLKVQEMIAENQTPELLEELRKKYSVLPGPYHECRSKECKNLYEYFYEKLNKPIIGKDIMELSSNITVNDSGNWFICYSGQKIMNNGAVQKHDWIMSNAGWLLDSYVVGDGFYEEIYKQACQSDGEVIWQ
ncbi:Hypothetical protein GbCGDNIH2_1565 [Granulibacter bethesdensis]|uniref:Uncharacterized protein n=2 Tax=Granulibacter bethesdensis TaxID=364410 RepID=Q0BRT9_GRABC|nr:Hypothetical protein GbCGDNIH1_1565 [Granulibacter bethesdensis CGDNIH1]AHJ68597.1 Hypothetical protein GbCGDNIH2_1565 [Granulibacter bethesdensis]APH64995.1 Hypothetical protein GbCGDNIH1I4_1565 [Granulibacter bethesdensis]